MTGTTAANDRRITRQQAAAALREKVEDHLTSRIIRALDTNPNYLADLLACMQELAIESGDFDDLADQFPTLYLDPGESRSALIVANRALADAARTFHIELDDHLVADAIHKTEANQ